MANMVPSKQREFGNHMAAEAETSHISSIILLYYTALAGYSWLCSYVPNSRIHPANP